MPKEIMTTPFKKWEFTEEEQLYASVFSEVQTQWIQNYMTDAAEEKLSIQYDPAIPTLHVVQEAYCRGQIDMCKLLIGISIDRKSALQKKMEEKHLEAQEDSSQKPLP